jgi:hypothetical protein
MLVSRWHKVNSCRAGSADPDVLHGSDDSASSAATTAASLFGLQGATSGGLSVSSFVGVQSASYWLIAHLKADAKPAVESFPILVSLRGLEQAAALDILKYYTVRGTVRLL